MVRPHIVNVKIANRERYNMRTQTSPRRRKNLIRLCFIHFHAVRERQKMSAIYFAADIRRMFSSARRFASPVKSGVSSAYNAPASELAPMSA